MGTGALRGSRLRADAGRNPMARIQAWRCVIQVSVIASAAEYRALILKRARVCALSTHGP